MTIIVDTFTVHYLLPLYCLIFTIIDFDSVTGDQHR